MYGTPGTVSKILWHFTGGPIRERHAYRPTRDLKSDDESYEAIVGILKSKELRLGSCEERIDVMRPTVERHDPENPKKRLFMGLLAPVCCLADIPIIHLHYHSNSYGKMAIGFHRESIVKAGFTPVFYQLEDSDIARAIINIIDGFDIIGGFALGCDYPPTVDESPATPNESSEEHDARIARNALALARQDACRIACMLKTFSPTEFDSIYAEREWRSTNPFRFTYDDVAMIVAPKAGDYFTRLCDEAVGMGIPRSIPIVAWEDLVEH